MPKVTLHFTLPEEKEELEVAQDGAKYLRIVEEMDEFLRQAIKYSDLTETEHDIYQGIRDHLTSLRNGNE